MVPGWMDGWMARMWEVPGHEQCHHRSWSMSKRQWTCALSLTQDAYTWVRTCGSTSGPSLSLMLPLRGM